MTENIKTLHSHSGLERELLIPKRFVLIDVEYKSMFGDFCVVETFKHKGVWYCKVPILAFVEKGGVFKNLDS